LINTYKAKGIICQTAIVSNRVNQKETRLKQRKESGMDTEGTENLENEDLKQEAVETTEKKSTNWDKDRQRADQEAANVRKLLAEREQLRSQLTTLQSQLAEQQAAIQKLSTTKQVFEEIPEVDANEADPEVIAKAINTAKKLFAAQGAKIAEFENKVKYYEQIEMNRVAQAERQAILERVCSKLEAEFGAGLRNEALELMNKINQEEGAPENSAEATLRLRDCFKKIKEKRDAENRKAKQSLIPPDGGGKSSFTSLKFKKGSLKEILAQARQLAGTNGR